MPCEALVCMRWVSCNGIAWILPKWSACPEFSADESWSEPQIVSVKSSPNHPELPRWESRNECRHPGGTPSGAQALIQKLSKVPCLSLSFGFSIKITHCRGFMCRIHPLLFLLLHTLAFRFWPGNPLLFLLPHTFVFRFWPGNIKQICNLS